MADNLTTPFTAGTQLATKDLGTAHLPKNMLADSAGVEVLGAVTDAPANFTIGSRLKAIVTTLTERLPTVGAKAASGSVSVTPSSDGFLAGLTGAIATAIQNAVEAMTPFRQAYDITPVATGSTTAISPLPRTVRVNTAGTVTFRAVDSTADVTITVVAGEQLPGRIAFIRTGGTATGFLGLA